MPANCTKTPENHGGKVFQLEHYFSDLWMIFKAAKSHSSGHVGIICQQGLGSACALVLWRPGPGLLHSQRQKAVCILGIRSQGPRRIAECFLGFFKVLVSKGSGGVQPAGVGDVHAAEEACLYNLSAPRGGGTVYRAGTAWAWILHREPELVCLPHQIWVQVAVWWGKEVLKGALDD